MGKLILKFAKFIYLHITKLGLDYEDEDVKELGRLIDEAEAKIKEREEI